MKSMYVGIDFDGTVVKHAYPNLGEPLDGAIETLHDLQNAGHKLILYTMRSGERLDDAVEYLEGEGVRLYAINENPSQVYWTESPKIFCHLYIDDCSLGCPIEYTETGRAIVDWDGVRELLVEREYLNE